MILVVPMKNGMNDARKIHKIWNKYNPDNLMPEKGYVIHHKDGNHKNNEIDNLQKMTKSDHFSLHNIDKIKSPETREKMSAWQKGKKLSKEHKQHLSENHADFSGENHPFYGKHQSEESKKLISKNKKGVPWSQARRAAQNNRNKNV